MSMQRGKSRWRYELQVLGPGPFLIPLLVMLGLVGLAGVLDVRHGSHSFIAVLLVAALEACVPLAVGIGQAAAAIHDDALEIQLTVPTAYRLTSSYRFVLILGWALGIEALATALIAWLLPWALPRSGGDVILLWLAPAAWFAALGALLALLLRSRSTTGAVLGSIWVVQLVFHGYFASYGWTRPWFLFATLYTPGAAYWRSNRLELLLTAVLCLALFGEYLRRPEWRFRGEDA